MKKVSNATFSNLMVVCCISICDFLINFLRLIDCICLSPVKIDMVVMFLVVIEWKLMYFTKFCIYKESHMSLGLAHGQISSIRRVGISMGDVYSWLCAISNLCITFFIYITMFVGLIIFYKIFSTFSMNMGTFCKILSVPQNIVMDLNNVLWCFVGPFTVEVTLLGHMT